MGREWNAFESVGLGPDNEGLYRLLLPLSGQSLSACAAALELEPEAFLVRIEPLLARAAASVDHDVLRVHPPARLIEQMVASESATLQATAARLEALRVAIPALHDLYADPLLAAPPDEVSGRELLEGGDVPLVLESWIRSSTGDVRMLRPDQWRTPAESPMRTLIGQAIEAGRRCRAIYPARALEEAPEALMERLAMGEEVRIVATVPSRMAIIGDAGVLLPELWGESNDRRIRVRQPGLQAALTALFDEIWDRAITLRPASSGKGPEPDATRSRRLLLELLAEGIRDEQIAGELGLSLRTVRRRVADLLLELRVDTRFQAGVEAVRRGLL